MNRQPSRRAVRSPIESLEKRTLMSVAVGLQPANTLVFFDTAAPTEVLATTKLKGIKRDALVGIDFRPATGQLFGISANDRLYSIDLTTGVATAVGAAPTSVDLTAGSEVGFDFNPVVDRIRVVNAADQNLRINPADGVVADTDLVAAGVQADGTLAYDAADANAADNPSIAAVAYTNNDADALTGTTLFGVDTLNDVLVTQGTREGVTPVVSPNAGTLLTVGALGVDLEGAVGFDIETSGTTNTAYVVATPGARVASRLYTVNTDTGAATLVGDVGTKRKATLDVAIAPAGTTAYVVTKNNDLIGFNTAVPNLVLSKDRISGLASKRERMVGIDFRPATGQLFALTDGDRFYTLDLATGAATAVGTAPTTIDLAARTAHGFDFNPTVDRIRVVNAAGQDLRANPNDGVVADGDPATDGVQGDGNLAYATGDTNAAATANIVGSAYTANDADALTGTTLYGIDATLDTLVTQGSLLSTPVSPNTGQLFTVGALGVDAPDALGFDILTTATGDVALAAFAPAGSKTTNVYAIDVATGAATQLVSLNKQVKNVVAMSVVPTPVTV